MDSSQSPDQNQSPENNQESNNSSSQHSPQNVYPTDNLNLDSSSPNPQSPENSKKNMNSNEDSPQINYVIDNSPEEANSIRERNEDKEDLKKSNDNLNEFNLLIEKEPKNNVSKFDNQESHPENQNNDNLIGNNEKIYENQQRGSPDIEQNQEDLIGSSDKNQILESMNPQDSKEKQDLLRNPNDTKIIQENKEESNKLFNNYEGEEFKGGVMNKSKQNFGTKQTDKIGKSNLDINNDNINKNSQFTSNNVMQKGDEMKKKVETKTNELINESEKELSPSIEGKIQGEDEKHQHTESPIDSPGKTKAKLRKLFMQYSDISDETGISRLHSRNFLKMLKEANLIDNNLTSCKADIVYCECNSKKDKVFGFEQFLNSIIKLAEIKFYHEFNTQKEECAMLLIRKFLIPLSEKYLSVDDSSKFSIPSKENNAMFSYDYNVKTILNSIYPILKEIYEIYFFHQMKKAKTNADLAKITPKLLVTFMREFDISPALINKQKALAFLDFIVKPDQEIEKYFNISDIFVEIKYRNGSQVQMDCGVHFTLSRFFLFLTWTAISVFEGLTFNVEYSVSEKLFFLLTKMELSKGFSNLTKSYSGNAGNKYSLIPPAQVLADIIKNNPIEKSSKIQVEESEPIGNNEEEQEKQEEEEEKKISEAQHTQEILKKMFISYCSIENNTNTNKINKNKFVKFLKDCNLIKQTYSEKSKSISLAEAELIYSKIIRENRETLKREGSNKKSPRSMKKNKLGSNEKELPASKLDFDTFVQAIQIVASKIYSNFNNNYNKEKAFNLLIEKYIIPNYEKIDQEEFGTEAFNQMFNILREEIISEFLGKVHKIILFYYAAYADSKMQMNYISFNNFLRDFGIFPDLCNKAMVHKTFYTLSPLNNKISEEDSLTQFQLSQSKLEIKSQDSLDDKLFVEALALCALQSKAFDRDVKPLNRIVHLLEKAFQSPGISIVKKKIGKTRIPLEQIDPLLQLKNACPKNYSNDEEKKGIQFSAIFGSGEEEEI